MTYIVKRILGSEVSMKLLKGMRRKDTYNHDYVGFSTDTHTLAYDFNCITKEIYIGFMPRPYSKECLRQWGYEELEIV